MAISSSLLGNFFPKLLIDSLIEDIYQKKKDKLIEDNGVRSSLGDAQKLLSTRQACLSFHSSFNL